jgi:DNA repair protein RadC
MRSKEEYKGSGHRGRLRDRFLQSGLDGFLDYEIVELLLTLGTPRSDCKQMAKEAIEKFNGLRGVLDASFEDLQEIEGIGPSNALGVKLFQAVSERYAKEKISTKTLLDSPEAVADYFRKSIGKKKEEHLVIMYLDTKNKLIAKEVSVGTLDTSLVHPREVFKPAIQARAAQVIVAHNHPSGDAEPSPEDLRTTRQLCRSGVVLGIEVLDHVIVTDDSFTSLKGRNLL